MASLTSHLRQNGVHTLPEGVVVPDRFMDSCHFLIIGNIFVLIKVKVKGKQQMSEMLILFLCSDFYTCKAILKILLKDNSFRFSPLLEFTVILNKPNLHNICQALLHCCFLRCHFCYLEIHLGQQVTMGR